MCGITGYINFRQNFTKEPEANRRLVHTMAQTIRHRGPDSWDDWVGEHAVFAHSRLAVIDPEGGAQPMKRTVAGYEFIITYNGELYNATELRRELQTYGYDFSTTSDTEVLLYAYIHYGPSCAAKLNGIFAFCIWDTMRQQAFLCRDRFGVKPLFYSQTGDTFVFGSELKALLAHPAVPAEVNKEGLCELFAISPARTQGVGVFKNIRELRPAKYMILRRDSIRLQTYWSLKSAEHKDSYDDTVLTVRALMCDSIQRQMVSDVPIATLLSGGLDSSIITAVAARTLEAQGQQLSTYSFDYVDNAAHFQSSTFQPDSDPPWAERMVETYGTNHTYLECDNHYLIDLLEPALLYKDLPGMADIDASLLYFCREIKKHHTVILSGECADEIFGGYPWFSDPKAFQTPAFPWCYDLSIRNSLLKEEVARTLDLAAYSRMRYDQSIAEVPAFEGDPPEEARRREITYLNMSWFMSSLLDRKDRMSMASGLEIRVPFCDHRLVEYAWNIPWDMKNKDHISKNILREAAKNLLPEDVLYRKKSPYPKTHHPAYEKAVKALFLDTISNPNEPLLAFADRQKLIDLCSKPFDYGKPFFGQLMAGPQLLGYLLQVNHWFKNYHPRIV